MQQEIKSIPIYLLVHSGNFIKADRIAKRVLSGTIGRSNCMSDHHTKLYNDDMLWVINLAWCSN